MYFLEKIGSFLTNYSSI